MSDHVSSTPVSGFSPPSASSFNQRTDGNDVDTILQQIPLQKKILATSWAKKRNGKEGDEDIRGPLGLRLLHSSPDPLIDLIFVHGLRGGSIKTWRKGNDPRNFWPKFWLPAEPGFRYVNIHSFGYDSDWASTKSSILNVHDFGRSLLEEMRNSPYLRDNSNRPVILIGHSMGGLVIKKAFILAKDVPDFKDRIQCIFFLATPHRGSDYAAVLNNILAVSGIMSSRDYITDLTTGSKSTELINSDFGKYASDLHIFSFYETLRMNLGVSSGLIVKKHSAILGSEYKNERAQYINANHRDICKFDSINDTNYITVKNALAGAIEDLSRNVISTGVQSVKAHIKMLKSFFGVWGQPDEHYSKVSGSCEWIDARGDFKEWRDPTEEHFGTVKANMGGKDLCLFWVYANPGTGKTFLASHIVAGLQELELECSYYFFHVGNKVSSSLATFLRSVACQMAISNALIRKRLVGLIQEGMSLDLDDPWSIWIKIFKGEIFQTPQYWVIDAMDECSKYQEFFTMLKGERPSFSLRIFATSRKLPDMQRLYLPLEVTASLTCIEIAMEDILNDIKRYIRSRIETLQIVMTLNKEELIDEILQRSSASFLWVRLILEELEEVYSHGSILQVLRSIPEGMIPYYERTIESLSGNKMEKHISKAILIWVAASSRSLSISELSQALDLDIGTMLPNAESAVEGLCGQLISIQQITGKVHLVHPTAYEFLLSEKAREFLISEPEAHKRIALACFKLISGPELRPLRNRRLAQCQDPGDQSPFLDYALTQFSEHVQFASSKTNELLVIIDRFFRTNVLSWIERIAKKGDLNYIIRASKNLRAFLDRNTQFLSTEANQVRNVDNWSVDLSRVVAKFGLELLQSPSSIYSLIPPLCPTGSAIHQQFGRRPDGLSIVGFKEATWDGCIASIMFGEDSVASTVSCGDSFIGVGMESGHINLYNHHSYKKERVLNGNHPIDFLHFTGGLVVACTIRFIILQDMKGKCIWQKRLKSRCILLTSADNAIVVVSENGHLLRWDISDGSLLEDQPFSYRSYDVDIEPDRHPCKAPFLASISPDMEILALGYVGGTICLWELQSGELVGWARDEEEKSATALIFNPNPNIGLLLVIYSNHGLSLYDSWSGSIITARKGNGAGVLSASCSPDGKTVATADTQGNIQVWDFESLTRLYHVCSPPISFRILSFTSDGSSIVDVADSGIRIWSPASLVRKNIGDHGVSENVVQPASLKGGYEMFRTSRITSLCSHPSLPIVFAGKFSGEVVVFNTKTGNHKVTLYAHANSACVTMLVINSANTIASGDVHGIVQVWNLNVEEPSTISCKSLLFEIRLPAQIHQLCFSASGNHLLIATKRSDVVYSTQEGSLVGTLAFEPSERKSWRWLYPASGKSKEEFLLLNNGVLQRFRVENFPSKVDVGPTYLQYELGEGSEEAAIDSAVIYDDILILDIRVNSGYLSSVMMFLFNLGANPSTGKEPKTLKSLSNLLPSLSKRFIGVSERANAILFLHNSWVSSMNREGLAENLYTQHFFIPNEYVAASNQVLTAKTADDSIVLCLYGELAILKNGLEFQDNRSLE